MVINMLVTITNMIKIEEPTKTIIGYCKNNLVFKNPDYDKKRRMGLWLRDCPKELKLYDIYEGDVYVPIGCFNDIWRLHPYREDYVDYSNSKPIMIASTIKLRDYQQPCLKAIEENYTGLFILPAGTGKTVTALQCVYNLKQKTLWLTNTIDLLNQAKTECENNMTCKTSTIMQGKCDLSGDIVFATVQTVSRLIDKGEIPQNTFGMVIGDEIQHCVISADSVMQFQKCMNYFASRYKLGLTATLHTSNGLHKTIPKIIGDVIYEMKKEEDYFVGYYEDEQVVKVPAHVFQVPAQINLIPTTYTIVGKDVIDNKNQTVSFTKLITSISEDYDRNTKILSLLSTLNGSTIVVGDRTDQLKKLSEHFDNDAVYVDGKTKKEKREQGLELVRQGKVKYLFATYKLICEGFNAPILENLVMVTPVKDLRIVVQSVGRVQRPYKNKKIANVYDLVDNVGKLDKFLKERKKIYKKEGYDVREW